MIYDPCVIVLHGDFLLDEPTSNLDALNEAIILRSIKDAAKDKTFVLVSHRPSSINIASKTFKMDEGRVS